MLPKPDDHTPSTAQIVVEFHGKLLKIDFLNGVLGVRTRELMRGISVLEVDADIEGKKTAVLIKVLHPVLCLKSRIVNMLSPLLHRTDRIARIQAEASIVIVRRFIHDALDEPDGWPDARDCLATLFRYLRSDEFVKLADMKLGIDPLSILRAFGDDRRIDQRYRNFQLRKMIAKIDGRRARRRQYTQ